MQNDTKFRTAGFLKVGVSLELEATEGATNFIAMAKLLNRWHKNKMKDAQSIGDDGSGSSIIMTKTETSERSVSSGTTSATLNHKSSNIQTIVDELGTYDKISKEIYEDRRLTNSAIKIVQSVQKLSSKGLVQEGLTAKEEKYMMNLASLMLLTEVERNETSIFTTPMFLEKAQTSDSAIEDYPMALKGAVMASRAVGILFTDTYP